MLQLYPFCVSISHDTQQQYQNVYLEILQYNIRFQPDHLKNVQENEAMSFGFSLDPPAKVKATDTDSILVEDASEHGTYEKKKRSKS